MIVFVAVAPMRVDAEGHDLEQRVERPDAAGGLDLDVRRRVGAHQAQVVVGRAARREPGRGLDEVGAGGLGQAAGADLLVVGQVGVLEDDLDDRAGGVGDLDDRGDVGLDVGVAAGLEGADLDDHVELGRAVGQRLARLEDLGRGRWLPCGKPMVVPTATSVPARIACGPPDVGRPDADRRDVVLGRQPAAVLDERVVELRPQQRVVDRLGDVALGQVVSIG